MNELFDAVTEFLGQPFGAVGAVCIMLAVTVINSQSLRARIGLSDTSIGHLFNGLNVVGGACLFVNAVQRSEVVWIVLEVYFVSIAVKGIVQTLRTSPTDSGDTLVLREPADLQPA